MGELHAVPLPGSNVSPSLSVELVASCTERIHSQDPTTALQTKLSANRCTPMDATHSLKLKLPLRSRQLSGRKILCISYVS